MPDDTDILGLPLILPNQAQKHVTHNESLLVLDAIVQLAVLTRDQTVPPALAVVGDRHIVPAGATLDWAGKDGQLAVKTLAGWRFYMPNPGWQAQVLAEGQMAVFDGLVWTTPSEGALEVAQLGVSATPDDTNRLSVTSPATLLNHAGAGHQLKLNKAAAGDTASLLFQTGFSGRAEMGTAGSDGFAVKVSANGTAWSTGLSVNPANGAVSLPNGLSVTGGLAVTGALTGTAVTQTSTDATAGRLLKGGDWGLGTQTTPFVANLDDTTLATGFWSSIGSTTGTFPAGENVFGQLIMMRYSATNFSQLWMSALSDTLYTRRYRSTDSPAWSPWRPLFSRHNLLGPVSQTAGVPTGRVIERGANANGDYVRFADGSQICTRVSLSAANASTALGALFRSADVTWTYPAAFVAAPVVSGDVDDGDCWMATAGAPGTTSAVVRVLAADTKAAAQNIRAVAVGRWF